MYSYFWFASKIFRVGQTVKNIVYCQPYISTVVTMERDYRDNQRNGYVQMRSVVDFTMAGLILAIGLIMLLGDMIGVKALTQLLHERVDSTMRYLFGALCVFYGGFRLYRAIKKDY